MKLKAPNTLICFHPRKAWFSASRTAKGKQKITFDESSAVDPGDTFMVRCGRCLGCRLRRALDWANRCSFEASMHAENCFVTLKYAPENLPAGGSLIRRDFQLFMKRLRKRIAPQKVRFFGCGEYGPGTLHPHFHVCLFGYDFADKVAFDQNDFGDLLYKSELLEELWGHGWCCIGELSHSSGGYCARYTLKKKYGKQAEEPDPFTGLLPYERLDDITGVIFEVEPEFSMCSNRPGIGAGWFDEYSSDVFPSGFLTRHGKKLPVPEYFMRLLERSDPAVYERVKVENCYAGLDLMEHPDMSPERLRSREACAESFVSGLHSRSD